MPPTKNIGLPDSLLSRFDLVFIVLDEKNAEIDRLIAERVTKNHRFVSKAEDINALNADDGFFVEPEVLDKKNAEVYEKFNAVFHNNEDDKLFT